MAVDTEQPQKTGPPEHDDIGGLEPHETAKLDQMEAGLRAGDAAAEPEQAEKASLGGEQDPGKGGLRIGRFRFTKRRAIIAGSGGGVVGILFAAFLFFGPILGPIHILQNLADFNFGPTDRWKERRVIRMLRDYAKKDNIKRRQIGRYDSAVSRKIKNWQFNRFKDRLRAAGNYDFVYEPVADDAGRVIANADGKEDVPTKIRTPDGDIEIDELIRNPSQHRDLVNKMINEVVPVVRWNKRSSVRTMAYEATGFRWSRFFGENAKKAWGESVRERLFRKQIRQPKDAGALAVEESDIDTRTQEFDEAAKNNDDLKELEGSSQDVKDVREAGLDAFEKTGDPKRLMAASEAEVKSKVSGKKASIFVAVAMAGCMAKSANDLDIAGKFERFASVVSRAQAIFNLAYELLVYQDVDLEELGEVWNDYEYEYDAINPETGTIERFTSSYANTASFQRMEPGRTVINGEEIQPQNRIVQEDGDNIIDSIIGSAGGFVGNIAPWEAFCDGVSAILGLPIVGDLLNIGLTVLDGVLTAASCVGTAGLTCAGRAAAFAAGEAVWYALAQLMMQPIIGILPETAEQAYEVLNQGASTLNTMESVTGAPTTNDQYNDEVVAYLEEQKEEMKHKSIGERYFAVSTKGSLAYQLAVMRSEMTSGSIGQNVARIIKWPFTGLANALSGPAAKAAGFGGLAQCRSVSYSDTPGVETQDPATCERFDNYGLPKYSYNPDLEANKINCEELWRIGDGEDTEMRDLIRETDYCQAGQELNLLDVDSEIFAIYAHKLIQSSEENAKLARICMGYDVATQSINYNIRYYLYNDPSKHSDAGKRNDDFKEYCRNKDNLGRMKVYARIGRYIDDLETAGVIAAFSNPNQKQALSTDNIYVVGDSITAGADSFYQAKARDRSLQITVNGQNSRALTGGTGKDGFTTIEEDRAVIAEAGVIVVALGTNPSNNFAADIARFVDRLKAINPQARIYWVDLAGHQDADEAGLSARNRDIYNQSGPKGYSVIPWFKTVFPAGDPFTIAEGLADDRNYIRDDAYDVHPTNTGYQAYVELVLSNVVQQVNL